MADGTAKPIKEVKPGDQVAAKDENAPDGDLETATVEAVHLHNDVLMTLALEDGHRIQTTEDHPFWSQSEQSWQRADQLTPGEQLLDYQGKSVTVVGFESDVTFEPAYNLTVTGLHTYHVITDPTRGPPRTVSGDSFSAAIGVLVHNCRDAGSAAQGARSFLGSSGWTPKSFDVGDGRTVLLSTERMVHVMTRHMPHSWDGSVASGAQTFFRRSDSIDDVTAFVGSAVRQNSSGIREFLGGASTQSQFVGQIGARSFTIGLRRNGLIGQFYPN